MPAFPLIKKLLSNFSKNDSMTPCNHISLSAAGSTDKGKVRTSNEDYFFIGNDKNIFLIADGMGGHLGGEVASKMSVEIVADFFSDNIDSHLLRDKSDVLKVILRAFQRANKEVVKKGRSTPSLAGMGCTLICGIILNGEAYIGHVGDVRCYYLADREMIQVTSDHSLEEESSDDSGNRKNNKVTRCIGAPASEGPDCTVLPLKSGDRLLFCSDGLWAMLNNEVIKEILMSSVTCKDACQSLINQANQAGGYDNISAIVVECTN